MNLSTLDEKLVDEFFAGLKDAMVPSIAIPQIMGKFNLKLSEATEAWHDAKSRMKFRMKAAANIAGQRGIALFIALLALLLISAVAIGMICMSGTETSIASNYRDWTIAQFAGKNGIEEVRDRMRVGAPDSLAASLPAPGSVLYVMNPLSGETITPWNTGKYQDMEICREMTCSGTFPSGSYAQATASASYSVSPKTVWKWVRITRKMNDSVASRRQDGSFWRSAPVDGGSGSLPICWGSTGLAYPQPTMGESTNCAGGRNPVYMLSVLALTASNSRYSYQIEAALAPPPFALPGALTLVGGGFTPANSGGTVTHDSVLGASEPGANFDLDGRDACGVADKAAVATYDNPTATEITDEWTGTAGPRAGTPIANLQGGVVNSQSALESMKASNGSLLDTVSGLEQLVVDIRNTPGAQVVSSCYDLNEPGLGSPSWGSAADPHIVVVTGDCVLSGNADRGGLLVVQGQLSVSGTPFNGAVLAIGQGSVTTGILPGGGFVNTGGGAATSFSGGLFIAKTKASTGGPNADGSYGTLLTDLGLPNAFFTNQVYAGNPPVIKYDSCRVGAAFALLGTTYTRIIGKELMF